ncbi:MAG: ABC transporter transmembrane domain-containing protein, partial [Leifsonia sp.]
MSGMRGMAAAGGGGGRGRVSGGDAEAQRALNATAPKIPHLFRRIIELFASHRAAIVVTIVLVLAGAALTVIPPLLTERAFDQGLFPKSGSPNLPVLVEIVVLMLVVYVVSALLGVWQTYLTASVGNKVMGALRVRLFSHLQSMELSFFTHTKTGIIQSRLQNDVGGVANVLTNTMSSILGNTVTVIAALVAMLLLNWQLTIVAVVLMPILVIA